MSFTKKMGKNIGKNGNKVLSSKYIQNLINHAEQSAIDALTTASKRAIQKTAETTGDLICNKSAGKITKVQKTSSQHSSETVEKEAENVGFDGEITQFFVLRRTKNWVEINQNTVMHIY